VSQSCSEALARLSEPDLRLGLAVPN
jgi:hypothetical protein